MGRKQNWGLFRFKHMTNPALFNVQQCTRGRNILGTNFSTDGFEQTEQIQH